MQGTRFFSILSLVLMLAAAFVIAPLSAQDRTLPYWASLRYEKVNMRVGPSAEYPVTWVYQRQGLPVKVVRLREGWRLIEDHEGAEAAPLLIRVVEAVDHAQPVIKHVCQANSGQRATAFACARATACSAGTLISKPSSPV